MSSSVCGTSSAPQGCGLSELASSSPLVSLGSRRQLITQFRMVGRSPSMKPLLAGSSSWASSTSLGQCSTHSGFRTFTSSKLFCLFRIPERFFPGKVDILFHSHQLFHCFVIAGAFVHYHGISNMALYRSDICTISLSFCLSLFWSVSFFCPSFSPFRQLQHRQL